MSTVINEVRRGFYLDSVALMRLSAQLGARDDVADAVLMIGTPANHDIMRDAGLLTADGEAAGPNDLVIALRVVDGASADNVLATARDALESGLPSTGSSSESRPRSLAGAMETLPDANLVLISTPGNFAVREARTALARGLNVMMFSDNVALEDERALKATATEQGLLLMGPDCGTAYIAGVPLAFANRVPAGDVGVIAASGTGLQEFAVLLARMGRGIAHGIGVGGRDLSDAVGGLTALTAIDLLEADPGTAHIVLISKPPGSETAAHVFERLARCTKPVTACVLGYTGEAPVPLADTLKAAAEAVAGSRVDETFDVAAEASALRAQLSPERQGLRGLYSGGTLCTEAQLVLQRAGVEVRSNAPAFEGAPTNSPHVVLDLGADEYTVGRPHPMIEPAVRSAPLVEALADPHCAVVLLDVVLGLGAHEDPAGVIVDALRAAGTSRPQVIASVCGTEADPQGLAGQVRRLEEAGVCVAPCNADAAAFAAAVIG